MTKVLYTTPANTRTQCRTKAPLYLLPTERLSSAPFSSTNQAHESYLSLSSRVTVKKPLRESSSGPPVGLGVEEWMEDEEGEEEEEERRWERWDWTE